MTTITLPIDSSEEASFTNSARSLGMDLASFVLSLLRKDAAERRVQVPEDAAAAAGKEEVRALVEDLRQYRQAVERGEDVPEEVQRRMQSDPSAAEGFVSAMRELQAHSKRIGLSTMTDEEIDAEIAAARRERRARKVVAA